MAPELCLEGGLSLQEVLDAILAGFERGSSGTDLTINPTNSGTASAVGSR